MNDLIYGNHFWRATPFGVPGAEARVDVLARQVEAELPLWEAHALLQAGGYQAASGLGSGRHYRKARHQGCYHLRIDGQRAYLHWDEWDPRRFPVEHFFETPTLWGSVLLALGLGAVVVAASKGGK